MEQFKNDIDRIYEMVRDTNKDIKDLVKSHNESLVEIGKLQVKSSIFGFVGGMFAIILFWAKSFFMKE